MKFATKAQEYVALRKKTAKRFNKSHIGELKDVSLVSKVY
jgi:hypothetical protein